MTHIKNMHHLCSECNACKQICSRDAIQMIQNNEGFSYPEVDKDKCVDCGLCVNVCPMINADRIKQETGKVYAAQLKDRKTLLKSSSGGVFSLIAEYVISKGGVVFGAAWDDHLQLHHIGVETQDKLSNLRGSKYVHSDIGNSYREVRDLLRKGRWVYFTGTPCQIAGLKLFLRKDYSNLLTSDLICHGTPSQKIFNRFVKQMEEDRCVELNDYQFRDKKVFGWSCSSSSSSIDKKTGKRRYHFYDKNMIAYFQAFIKGHITREDCYQCPFACPQRVSDITLADYWDISSHHKDFPNQRDGVSLITVNSSKGLEMLSATKDKVTVMDSTIEYAIETSNHNLKAPTPRPKERDTSCKKVFTDFISARDFYASFGKTEDYYNRIYRNNRIKQIPFIRAILKLLGKV